MTDPFNNNNHAHNVASMNKSNNNNIQLSVDTKIIRCNQRKRKKSE